MGEGVLGGPNSLVRAGRPDRGHMWLVRVSSERLDPGLHAGTGQAGPLEPEGKASFCHPEEPGLYV